MIQDISSYLLNMFGNFSLILYLIIASVNLIFCFNVSEKYRNLYNQTLEEFNKQNEIEHKTSVFYGTLMILIALLIAILIRFRTYIIY
jgi:hypothetical protein